MSADIPRQPVNYYQVDFDNIPDYFEQQRFMEIYSQGQYVLVNSDIAVVNWIAKAAVSPAESVEQGPEAQITAFRSGYVVGLGLINPDPDTIKLLGKQIKEYRFGLGVRAAEEVQIITGKEVDTFDPDQAIIDNIEAIKKEAIQAIKLDVRREQLFESQGTEFFDAMASISSFDLNDEQIYGLNRLGYGLAWFFMDLVAKARYKDDLAKMIRESRKLNVDTLITSILDSAGEK